MLWCPWEDVEDIASSGLLQATKKSLSLEECEVEKVDAHIFNSCGVSYFEDSGNFIMRDDSLSNLAHLRKMHVC